MKRFTILVIVFLSSSLWGFPPKASCILINMEEFNHYSNQTVRIEVPSSMKMGNNIISIVLSKPTLPSGYIVAAYFDVLERPQGKEAEVEDGYPYSSIRFFQPGSYTIEGKVNLVYRGS